MYQKKKKFIKTVGAIAVLVIVWLVLFVADMRYDIQCVMGTVEYQNYYITDFSGCVLNDCELEEDDRLVFTGPDPYVILDSKILAGVSVRDILLDLDEDSNGFKSVKWYWNVGDGYSEKLTYAWDALKSKDGSPHEVEKELYGVRLDMESPNVEEGVLDLDVIIFNTLSIKELKMELAGYFIISLIVELLLIAVLLIINYIDKQNVNFLWILKGIGMELIYFVLLPLYQSGLPYKIKLPVVILNVLLVIWIAFVGRKKDVCEE